MDSHVGINRRLLRSGGSDYVYYDITSSNELGIEINPRLPHVMRILLENVLRNMDGRTVTLDHARRIASWAGRSGTADIPFMPSRILLQDFTGVPLIVDLAAMRTAMRTLGGDAGRIQPLVPVDLVVDHSVTVDAYGSAAALDINVDREFSRNAERYALLRWAQQAFTGLRVFPPAMGIVHQVNLEFLAQVVTSRPVKGETHVFPDTLVGTDSHTTMVNGIGVLGWGVGGIEAEAAMLGQPLSMLLPDVVGVRLEGRLPERVTATDLVLTVTERLRQHGVVGRLVEFWGDGVPALRAEDRATVANMCPEYGATAAYFPVDAQTLDYLRATGRRPGHVGLAADYCQAQGLFRDENTPEPAFTTTVTIDLSGIEPSVAGPHRPQDRISLHDMKAAFIHPEPVSSGDESSQPEARLTTQRAESMIVEGPFQAPAATGSATAAAPAADPGAMPDQAAVRETALATSVQAPAKVSAGTVEAAYDDGHSDILHPGSVVIAAITSCTNTSNPAVVVAAGLMARNAIERGLSVPRHVKTSLAPGSLAVTAYLKRAGLLAPLEALGFHVVGYGCTTCIGNSGPLAEPVARALAAAGQQAPPVAAVLSGNRNFEGRIHPQVKLNYLASPPLVVAFALAGRVNIDFEREPLGIGSNNQPVLLRDIWPDDAEVRSVIQAVLSPALYGQVYTEQTGADRCGAVERWGQLPVAPEWSDPWTEGSAYIQRPPYLDDMPREPEPPADITDARCLALLGDSVTTDHISPAGSIPVQSEAGRYLLAQGVAPEQFNSYGSRRGAHEVMMRGTFASIRLRNRLVPGVEGGMTRHFPEGETMSIFAASARYRAEGVPLVVIAGREYGTGSSRDWAAKGPSLLGVRAVLAQSFERIHRSNLIGMGILPLEFEAGSSAESLDIKGDERFKIEGIADGLAPGKILPVTVTRPDGACFTFAVIARLDSDYEVDTYDNGGILPLVMRGLLATPAER